MAGTSSKRTRGASEEPEETDLEGGNVQEIPFVNKGRTADRDKNPGKGNKVRFSPDEADGSYLVGTLYIPVATIEKYGEPKLTVLVEFPA